MWALEEKVSAHSAILKPVLPQFQPMPLLKRRSAFDDPSWIFELKYDGFRALAIIDRGRIEIDLSETRRLSEFLFGCRC